MRNFLGLILLLLILSGCSSSSNNSIPAPSIAMEPSIDATFTPSTIPNEIISETEDPVLIEAVVPTEKPDATESRWHHYINARYGYSISYPSEWETGEEAHNGDGKILYIGNPDVDIRVYGGFYIEGVTDTLPEDLDIQWITLDNGLDAQLLVGYEDDKYVMHLIHYDEDYTMEYHFYSKVSKSFFEKNEKVLLKAAKSLELL
ncbi:hypothetical protein ABEW34_01695 [Paenibacillus algorifonticola]|uniref:hypothetical protein n=1 Tax=Paenibacillus algorifonticola TaxID=684063 RepID=UPI003D297A8C